MKPYHTFLLIMLLAILSPSKALSIRLPDSLKKITAFFGATPYDEIFEKKYTITPDSQLTITNMTGSILIKSDWKANDIQFKATKHVKRPEFLKSIQILDAIYAEELRAHISCQMDAICKGSVDYELIIPSSIRKLILRTKNGNIIVHSAKMPIDAFTENGEIQIANTTNDITVKTHKGSILLDHIAGNIVATTYIGNITIHNATQNICAKTQKGTIQTSCSGLPADSSINLTTVKGPIELKLPKTVNATLYGNTTHGTITSSCPITIASRTTTLDSKEWRRFKQEVDGIIGSGNARINVTCKQGNIKILQG